MKKYNAILIGNGTMGKRHRARFESCGVEFVAIYDSKECTVKSPLESLDADFVVIASPASTHYNYVKDFLNRGIPVFVEKPLATTAAEAQELVDLALSKEVPLFVAQSECFNPIFLNFRKQMVAELKMAKRDADGKINLKLEFRREHGYSERCRDVNVALDLMVHDLSMFLTMFKYENVQLENFVNSGDDESWAFLRVVSGEYAGVEACIKVNRNSNKDVRMISASFDDAEYIVSLAKYRGDGEVEHVSDSLDNEHRFFLRLLYGACKDWGRRAAQNAANAVKIAAG
ncbi:MAG: Gfo/Idh/MocA family oxidoreductase [Fibrobacter sp.]|nr:Gfo/Idh/MocA family oxidoreductase [Fibrobacter sp.]